jgi:hypothetical protein
MFRPTMAIFRHPIDKGNERFIIIIIIIIII